MIVLIIKLISIISVVSVITSFVYGIREMIKINTNHQYHFGLGLLLISLALLSLFPQEWIKYILTIGISGCIYFFILIIKQDKIEK